MPCGDKNFKLFKKKSSFKTRERCHRYYNNITTCITINWEKVDEGD